LSVFCSWLVKCNITAALHDPSPAVHSSWFGEGLMPPIVVVSFERRLSAVTLGPPFGQGIVRCYFWSRFVLNHGHEESKYTKSVICSVYRDMNVSNDYLGERSIFFFNRRWIRTILPPMACGRSRIVLHVGTSPHGATIQVTKKC